MLNLANKITMCRIILVPVFVLAMMYHRIDLALLIFIAASITDGLDGYIARSRDQITSLGKMLDPLADKFLILAAYLSFSLVGGLPEYLKMPIYVPIIIISRDVILVIGGMVINHITGNIEVQPTVLGKVTTFFQMLTIIALLFQFIHSSWLWNITVLLTVVSGLDYLRIGSRQVQANGKTQ
jgi:cardiolipin synthase (CMP-forming)